jgi:hypothetical protein
MAQRKNKFPTLAILVQHILGILANQMKQSTFCCCWNFDYILKMSSSNEEYGKFDICPQLAM